MTGSAHDKVQEIADALPEQLLKIIKHGRQVVAGDQVVTVSPTASDINAALSLMKHCGVQPGDESLSDEEALDADVQRRIEKGELDPDTLEPIDTETDDAATER